MNTLIDDILARLEPLGAWLYHETPESAYIKFADTSLGSLRISNHDGRPGYRYKWNIRYDFLLPEIKDHDGVTRRYYPVERIEDFYKDIQEQL
jgi:hypothetical protein